MLSLSILLVLTWTYPWGQGCDALTCGNPTNFVIERRDQNGVYSILAITGTSQSYNDSSAVVGNTYCYRVSGRNSAGDGPTSNEACGTQNVIVTLPNDLSAKAIQSDITVTWTPPNDPGVGNLRLERKIGSAGWLTHVQSVPLNQNSLVDKTLPAETYSYRLRVGTNSGAIIGFSNVGTATVAPAPPGGTSNIVVSFQ